MIEMDQKEQILHYHRVDGLSLREISRRVGLNRKTVTRYVREYEASIREDPEEGLDICIASKPKYPTRNVECTRMTEPVCAEIEYWLQENAKRRQIGMRKCRANYLFGTLQRTKYCDERTYRIRYYQKNR